MKYVKSAAERTKLVAKLAEAVRKKNNEVPTRALHPRGLPPGHARVEQAMMLCWRTFGESWVGRLRWNAWRHAELLKHELPVWP